MKQNSFILSYEITLPQRIYPALDRLFSVFKWKVRDYISVLWNEKGFQLLGDTSKQAAAILKDIFSKPATFPSRFHRNILKMAGEIVRSQIERKAIYDYLIEKPCRILLDESILARELKVSSAFVLNVQRQLMNQVRREGNLIRSYFSAVRPSFSGRVVITSADDNLHEGQFRRLKFSGRFLEFEIKVPDGNSWKWIKVKKFVPERLKQVLTRAVDVKAPLIKRVDLKSGYKIYRLVIPLEFETKIPEKIERVFALDLSPSEKRLGVGVIVAEEGYSKPVFFSAYKMIRKLERIYKEISNLRRKIDRIRNQIEATSSRGHAKTLKGRLKHLVQEERLRWRKFRELRKQILEVFTLLVVKHAKAYHCQAIAVENLSFRSIPDWKDKKFRRLFAQWLYSKFLEKLEYKALKEGVKVLKVSPAYTSRICHRCGHEVKADRLIVKCSCGQYDRDYNAAVNLGLKILKKLNGVGSSKSRPYMGEDIPGRVPFRQGTAHPGVIKWRALLSAILLTRLLAYLKLVETSYLKFRNLLKLIGKDKYG